MLDLPEIPTVVALPALADHTESPALDVQCRSFGQGLRYFIARLAHDPLKRGTGDVHLLGGVFLIPRFQVNQAKCLQFLV
jgi:hypothetical protein